MIATLESTQPVSLPNSSPPLIPPLVAPPPSPRDLQAFELVAVQSKTTREAAALLGISQTRVRQVLARVVEFLAQAVPGTMEEQTPEERVRVAEHVAQMRLDFLYSEALTMWRTSQTPTSSCPLALGKVCFLNQAMRIAVAAAKVPLRPLPVFADERPQQPEQRTTSMPAQPPTNAPPARDCSEPAVSSAGLESLATESVAINESDDKAYRTLDEIKAEARKRFLRPAQTPAPHQDSLPERGEGDRPLSRRERRARQHELVRAKRLMTAH